MSSQRGPLIYRAAPTYSTAPSVPAVQHPSTAQFGLRNNHAADGDYPGTIEALLAAGAPTSFTGATGDPGIDALIARYRDVYADAVSADRRVGGFVADDRTWGVVIAPESLDWLYLPYDGGADVPTAVRRPRDELAAAHREWLSSHPAGL